MKPDAAEQARLATLLRSHRWASLATTGPDGAEASFVAYAIEGNFSGFLLHLSTLSSHTRNLTRDARVSLGISEAERAGEDPQLLMRATIQGTVRPIPRETDDYASAAQCYLQRLPAAQQWFTFGDFLLFRLTPERVRFVAGFARAYTLNGERLHALANL